MTDTGDKAASKGSKKRLSVERIYQKKTQLEHILLRPDTYIGSVQPVTEKMWVLDEDNQIVNREITYVPGLYKIFDEILVNAADNKQRDKKMDTIKIDINAEQNEIKVFSSPFFPFGCSFPLFLLRKICSLVQKRLFKLSYSCSFVQFLLRLQK